MAHWVLGRVQVPQLGAEQNSIFHTTEMGSLIPKVQKNVDSVNEYVITWSSHMALLSAAQKKKKKKKKKKMITLYIREKFIRVKYVNILCLYSVIQQLSMHD